MEMTAFSTASSFIRTNELEAWRKNSLDIRPVHRRTGSRRATPLATLAEPSTTDAVSDFSVLDESSNDEAWESFRSILPFSVLRKLRKSGQYLGNEQGAKKKEWNSVNVRFVMAFPDLYSIGMSSTGHVVLYSVLNDDSRILCDRAYMPESDMEAALLEHNKSLFAVESKRPLADFDIVGMSVMYELCATNCLKMMQLARIPYTWRERDEQAPVFRDGAPLVFAGGLTATSNPEPYADFFDFFSIGDGENMLPEIGRVVDDVLNNEPRVTRHDLLLAIAQRVKGVYVPRFYESSPDGGVRPIRPDVPARIVKQNALPEPWRAMELVPLVDPIHNRLSIEVRRGCTRGCRFCLPGNVQRPARDVAPEVVRDAVKLGLDKTGYNEFSFLSLSCSDWLSLPSMISLKNEFKADNIALSLGSQRVDRFDHNIARLAGGVRKSGLTFAPEAGTQRMRDLINKGLSNEDLLRGVSTAYSQGWSSVKLYFMIGFPGETDDDILGIASTVKWLQRKCRRKGKRMLGINLTISNFTPKPHTPFQWHSVTHVEMKRKQNLLKKAFFYTRYIKVNFTDVKLSAMEDFIGRGDRRLSKVILKAHMNGAGMDAWWGSTDVAHEAWTKAIEECGLGWKYRRAQGEEWDVNDTALEEIRGVRGWYEVAKKQELDRRTLQPKEGSETTETSQSPLDRPLPWDHIDCGLDKGWLRDELFRALAGTLTPDCAFNECSMCGVCGDELGNNITIPPPPIPKFEGNPYPNCERVQRMRVTMRKKGHLALASHLDTMHMLDRVVRISKLPISYNGGYHPYMRISTASALAFGATADREPFDFVLTEKMTIAEFTERLAGCLPEGIEVVGEAVEVPLKEPSLNATVAFADYSIAVTVDDDVHMNWPDLLTRVEASGPVLIEKTNKNGKVGKRDLRSLLQSIRIGEKAEVLPVLGHIGVNEWPRNGIILHARVCCSDSGALGSEDLVRLLNVVNGTVNEIELLHVHRIGLYDSRGGDMKDSFSMSGTARTRVQALARLASRKSKISVAS